jgi:type I restriction enzyme S subunit
MIKWDRIALGKIVDFRNGVNFSREDEGTGIPIIKVKDFAALRKAPLNNLDQLEKSRINIPESQFLVSGDILVVRSNGNRDLVGRSIIYDGPSKAVTFSGFCIRLRVTDPNVNPDFLHYWMRSPYVRAVFSSDGGSTAINNLSQVFLSRQEVALPSLDEQIDIASLLSALDDKIELNRRMNETLEAMARAIFRDWFVDFGPTRAKAEGRAPYLAPEIWSLFPDLLDDDGKPAGWSRSTIGREVEVVGGSTPSTKEPRFWDGVIAWATPKDLSSLRTPVLLETERTVSEEGLAQIGSGLLPPGTVLLSSRAPIGYLAVSQIPVAINQGFIAMICNQRLSNVFVWLWTQANMDKVHQKANGSTFQEISKANFRPIDVCVASTEVLAGFDELMKPIFEKIVSNEIESRTLAATRDLLLPKLMSGEIRVKDAERLAETASPEEIAERLL